MTTAGTTQRSFGIGLDDAMHRVRARGGRLTPTKRRLLEDLHQHQERVTADELIGRHGDIDPATIYRALHQFEEAGIIEHVHFGHGPAAYRWLHERTVPAMCEACGMVIDLPADEVAAFATALRERHGIELALGHFALSIRCADCLAEDQERLGR